MFTAAAPPPPEAPAAAAPLPADPPPAMPGEKRSSPGVSPPPSEARWGCRSAPNASIPGESPQSMGASAARRTAADCWAGTPGRLAAAAADCGPGPAPIARAGAGGSSGRGASSTMPGETREALRQQMRTLHRGTTPAAIRSCGPFIANKNSAAFAKR